MTTTQSAPSASVADSGIEYGLHVGYTNEYLFRGISLGQDLVEAGANVSGEAFGLGLSAGVWYANYQKFNEININEIDMYAAVSKDFGFLTASVGYIYYYNNISNFDRNVLNDFFGNDLGLAQDQQEVYFALSRDLGFATASLTYYWDVVLDNDGYSEFALARSFELISCLALNVGTNVGYLAERGVPTAWTTKVSLDYSFVERAKLSPFAAFSLSLSDPSNSAYDGNQNEFVAGSMLSVSF